MRDPAQAQLKRAWDFLEDARRAVVPEDTERYLASATESAVSIVEFFLDQSRNGKEVLELAGKTLPRYRLLKRVRIHNFHRRPIPYFSPEEVAEKRVLYIQGPIELRTGGEPNSYGAVIIGKEGFVHQASDSSSKIDRKPGPKCTEPELCIIDGKLVDEAAHGELVRLEVALVQFLVEVPKFLDAIASMSFGKEPNAKQ